MPASARYHFDSQSSLVKKSITAGGTTTATLDSTTGVSSAAWEIVSAYGSVIGDWSLSATSGTSTVVTAPSGSGKSCILQCKVNGGVYQDPVTGRQTAGGETIQTAKIYIAPETIVPGEELESDATDGYSALINAPIVALGGAGTPTFASVTVSDTDASLAIARTAANKITASTGSGDALEIDCDGAFTLDVGTGTNIIINEAETERLRVVMGSSPSVQALSGILDIFGQSGVTIRSGSYVQLSGTFISAPTSFRLDSAISPTSLSASQNDYNPTSLSTANTIRQDASNNVNITGLQGGANGRIIIFHNISAANTISFTHEDAASSAANRFVCPSSATLTIPVGGTAVIRYDGTSSRWRIVSKNF